VTPEEHEDASQADRLGHGNIGFQAVADDDRVGPAHSEPLQQGGGHVAARLADDRFGLRAGAGLDRGQHRCTVRQTAYEVGQNGSGFVATMAAPW
jgi:hypothetical protein